MMRATPSDNLNSPPSASLPPRDSDVEILKVRVLRVPQFCRIYGRSRARAYELMDDGVLTYRKDGASRLIDAQSAEDWWKSLPKGAAKAKMGSLNGIA